MIYPNRCQFCGELLEKDKRICSDCASVLPVINGKTCIRCGLEIENCTCKPGDFAFVSNSAPYRYVGPVKSIIKRLKFKNLPQLAVLMSEEMVSVINERYKDINFDFVTYVPSVFYNRIPRGFNQAHLLAKYISKRLDIPLKMTLGRKWGGKEQKSQSARARFKNIKGRIYTLSKVKGTVLLVDDVMTTGATLSECAYMLKKAGASQVFCVTYAITCKK